MTKSCEIDGKQIEYDEMTEMLVQIGRNASGYRTRYRFLGNPGQAVLYYRGLNVGRGYKKRLLIDGKVIARQFS